MTPEQMQLVRLTLAQATADHRALGQEFYRRLLIIAPDLRARFHGDVELESAKLKDALKLAFGALSDLPFLVATLEALAALNEPAAKRYAAQVQNGESPWNTIDPPRVDAATIERTEPLFRLIEPVLKAPVVLVICVDLKVVASTDQHLDRVGVISGASIYPFAWNILLAARARGFAGTITTLAVAQEPKIKQLLGLPSHVAVAAVMPLGRPVKQLTKLTRKPVSEFAMRERWGGAPLA